MFLRRPDRPGSDPSGEEEGRSGLDAVVVPSLLLLLARDLLVRDPPRILAWRLLHDPQLAGLPGLAPFLPRPSPEIDRDPIALLLATVATLLAGLYLWGALSKRSVRFRAGIVATAALLLIALPTASFMAMGYVTGRPYGQDGGVVQLPLAMDKILAGESPYTADYSDTILGKEARTSKFWATRGGNPILHHHAYLPGTHLLLLPFHMLARAAGTTFDPRVVTLAAYFLAALLATRFVQGASARLSAAAVVLLNPLVYWHQIFGANDVVFVALILGATLLLRSRPLAAAAVLGFACATKQLAWPFAPFLLLAGAGPWWPDFRPALARALRMTAVLVAVFAAVVLPVAALDFRAIYADIIGYNVGLPGIENYPLGGTPGFGFANFLIYFGAVQSLGEYFPFSMFYVLVVPLVVFIALPVLRRGDPAQALAAGAAALLASLYFSRVVHPNYLIPAAILLPVAVLASRTLRADLAVVPLLLLSVAVELIDVSPLKLLWDDAVAARLPQYTTGLWQSLLPRCGPALTDDPLTLLWAAVTAGLAIGYLCAVLLGAGPRVRLALTAAALVLVLLVPAIVVMTIGQRTGIMRAQDEWVVDVRAAGDAITGRRGAEPPWAREAFPTSFRDEPARRLEAARWPIPAGSGVLAGGLRLLGLGPDPRWLSVVAALVLFGAVAASRARSQHWSHGALLLGPAAASAVVFGGGAIVALACLGAAALWGAGRAGTAARGAAGGVSLEAGLGLAARASGEPSSRARALRAIAIGLGVGLVPIAASRFLNTPLRAALPEVGPGLGLPNLWLYFGATPGLVGFAILGLSAVAAGVWILRRVSSPALAAAALLVVGLLIAPSASADLVLLPIGLLALHALDQS